MIKFIAAVLLSVVALMAQPADTGLPVDSQAHCQFKFGPLTAIGTLPTPRPFDNRQMACTYWEVTYVVTGFSAVSVQVESAPMGATVNLPGTFVAFAGTLLEGANPSALITQSRSSFVGYYPWMRVNFVSKTGTGTVTGIALGYLYPPNSVVGAGSYITSAATTVAKGTAGILKRITVNTLVASATIKLFDLAAASCTGTPSTNPKGVITLPSTITGVDPFTLEYNQTFANGICVLTSGVTDISVVFQ